MKNLFLSISALLLAGISFGQEHPNHELCGTDQALEIMFLKEPELAKKWGSPELLKNSLVNIKDLNYDSEKKIVSYEIPVVFHILHMYGTENIADSKVYEVMELLNEDYSATNSDIIQVVTPFDTVIADMEIRFKLAAIDPFGNCTNGIEHIYTHETNTGDMYYHKVGQWNRARYMNIWVTKEPGNSPFGGTLLGYATFPPSTDGTQFWTDGVVLRSTTVGGTDPYLHRTLTHEGGHWLSLLHPFQGGDPSDPNTCGDDGVADTPPTSGTYGCNLSYPSCDTNYVPNIANVQNFMDYSSCPRMFTEGQRVFVHNTLNGIAGQRNQLWQDSTLIMTGVKDLQLPQDPNNPLTVPLCAPVADFYTPDRTLCKGSFAQFEDHSWNALIDSRQWTFEGGSPATSTSANPVVSWNTSGWKKVTLTVTNAAGSDTREIDDYVYVSNDWADYTGPVMMNLEGNSHYYFLNLNYEWNYGKFKVVDNYGYDQSRCFKLANYKDISQADPFTDEGFYNVRLGESVDDLITASLNLSNTSNVVVKFRYAYATNATDPNDITEKLKVYASKNCGETWQTLTTINGTNLVTAGFAGNQDFNPTSNTMWGQAQFNYAASATDTKTRFKFEFTASDLSSNLFIDNIEITGILGVADETIQNMQLSVFPNPSNGEAINVEYYAQNEPTQFTLRDVQGKVIAEQVVDLTNAFVNTTIDGTENLPSACYFLEVTTGDHSVTKKVVVL